MTEHAFARETGWPEPADGETRSLPPALRTRDHLPSLYTPASERRRQILEHYRYCAREALPSPTVRESGEAVGLLSSSTVQSHIRELLWRGHLIQHHATGSRTVLLLREWWRPEPQGRPCGECGRW